MTRACAALLVVFAWLLLGTSPALAKAYADQGEAYAACQAALSALRARAPAYYQTQTWRVNKACAATPVNATTAGYTCSLDLPGVTSCASGGGGNINTDENGGSELYEYPLSAQCSTRSPVYAGFQGSTEKQCGKGCEYAADSTPQEKLRVDQPNSTAINFQRGRWVPTGNVCASQTNVLPPPRDDYCTDLAGGYKMCRDTRGRQCVVSPKTGRKYCASDTEAMNATNPERTENVTKTPASPAPGIPTTPVTPRPTEDWKETAKATVTNTTTNTTTNTSISGNAGTPSPGGSPTPGDGSDNPGESDGDDEGEGAGQVGEGVGELYEGKGKSVSDVFGQFKNRVMAAPIANAGTQFMTVSIGNGCPVFTVPATEFWEAMVFDFHCNGALADALSLCGYMLLAVAAYQAFKWGFL